MEHPCYDEEEDPNEPHRCDGGEGDDLLDWGGAEAIPLSQLPEPDAVRLDDWSNGRRSMEDLIVGKQVHYVHPNGTHSPAKITQVWDKEFGVVNLFIRREDYIEDEYHAATVVYSKQPVPYSWHFVEDDLPADGDDRSGWEESR